MRVNGESFVLAGEEKAYCLYQFIEEGSFRLYNIDEKGNPSKVFEEGKDYRIDCAAGTICRTAASEIPDYAGSRFFGEDKFNPDAVPNLSNAPYLVYADYETGESRTAWPAGKQCCAFPKMAEKLKAGKTVDLVIFGDSISTGAEATHGHAYYNHVKQYLEEKYGGTVNLVHKSAGGDSSMDALKRISSVMQPCDGAVIAFGMNDQNVFGGPECVPVYWYANNIGYFIDVFKLQGAETLVLAPHAPNPKWIHSSEHFDEYACAAKRMCMERDSAFVNVNEVFRAVIGRGKTPECLLRNNINHPNDFGHKLYFEAIRNAL